MISIIIPTFNERESIIRLIDDIEEKLIKSKNIFEIIVVDDNSPDGTGEVIKGLSNNHVRLFVRKNQRGLGSAILFGIKKARGDIIIGMDADFNHPPESLIGLISGLRDNDLVVASRFIKSGGMEDRIRYAFTYIFNLFLKYILGFPTMDNMSGFYAIKKESLMKLPIDKIYQGYGEYHLRLVYLANKLGLKVEEFPVFYKKRRYGESKSNLLKMFYHYLLTAYNLKLKDGRI